MHSEDLGTLFRPRTRILKKKKLKINVHRPLGTRVSFDDEGNPLAPLAKLADIKSSNETFVVDKGMPSFFVITISSFSFEAPSFHDGWCFLLYGFLSHQSSQGKLVK